MKKISSFFLFVFLVVFGLNMQAGTWEKNKHNVSSK